ncbi:MAG: hypothetical protein JOZ15_07850, partial [Acidobacteria bacterium]|nr:hypothetical protein [Acidobacteriota bacterium]
AGLISHRRQGRWSYYALDPEAFREIESFLGESRAAPAAGPCCAAEPDPLRLAAPAAAAPAAGWVHQIGRGRKEQR